MGSVKLSICILLFAFNLGVSLADDLTLTHAQKLKLDKFRDLVRQRLPHKYMEEDIYLVRWLRAQYFNIPAAEKMLMNNLKWRKENKIDTILEEDWSVFDKEFRFEIQGCDREGRPIISVPVGDWDIRRQVIAGKSLKMMRFFDKLFEEVTTAIRRSQEKGENVTQYDFIFEMSNYNLVLQGCPLCIPVYIHLFQAYDNYYPGSVYKTAVVNVPQIFLTLWEIIRPFLSPMTQETIQLYGKNKPQWKAALRKYIDASHLTKEFGGLKSEGLSFEDLKENGDIYFKCSNYEYRPKRSKGYSLL